MCDCFPSSPLSFSVTKFRNLGLTNSNWKPIPFIYTLSYPKLLNPSTSATRVSKNPSLFGPEEFESYGKSGFKEKEEFELTKEDETSSSLSSGLDYIELKGGIGNRRIEEREREGERDMVEVGKMGKRRGRQVMRRSNMIAKQVISIRTALSLGFVSQLWVDTTCWVVLFVEVRPNLLSGESERFLLEDVSQVGDVVLVQDESVMENEFKMLGLETLVGYKVVTPGRRNIGKVRGYSFNINSGAVESLELDSFGISIIPSTLVSTYALFVEDVLEVLPDAVVVHEAAASRIQRLTKGFLGTQNVGTSIDDGSDYGESVRSFGSDRFDSRNNKTEDDWELPMDYL